MVTGLEGYPFERDDVAVVATARRSRRTGSSTWTRSRSSITPGAAREPVADEVLQGGAPRPASRRRTTGSTDRTGWSARRASGPGRWTPRCASRSKRSAAVGFSGHGTARSRSSMPAGINPAKCDPWGLDSFQLFPNFVILIWGQGWYLTYHYWPTSYNTPRLRGHFVFPAAAHAAGAGRAGAGRGDIQGIRFAGRQHVGGHPDDDRIARRRVSSCSMTRRCCCGICTTRRADWVESNTGASTQWESDTR